MGRNGYSELESIIFLAKKFALDPNEVMDAFVESWKNDRASVGKLNIACREVHQDSVMFLVTSEEKVVSQFPIQLKVLNNPVPFRQYFGNIHIPDHVDEMGTKKQKKINDLRSRMRGVSIEARIIEVPPRRLVNTRWGNQAYVSNVKIADETGLIKLPLWNEQINEVHVGDVIKIENGYIYSFAGQLQLRLGRKGILTILN